MKLVVGHRVEGALEPVDVFRLRKGRPGGAGDPHSLVHVASLGVVLVAGAAVRAGASPFLEAHDLSRLFGQDHRKGETGVPHAVVPLFGRQTETPVEGRLRAQVDAAICEIGVEPLLRCPFLRVEPVQFVVRYVERPDFPVGWFYGLFPECPGGDR